VVDTHESGGSAADDGCMGSEESHEKSLEMEALPREDQVKAFKRGCESAIKWTDVAVRQIKSWSTVGLPLVLGPRTVGSRSEMGLLGSLSGLVKSSACGEAVRRAILASKDEIEREFKAGAVTQFSTAVTVLRKTLEGNTSKASEWLTMAGKARDRTRQLDTKDSVAAEDAAAAKPEGKRRAPSTAEERVALAFDEAKANAVFDTLMARASELSTADEVLSGSMHDLFVTPMRAFLRSLTLLLRARQLHHLYSPPKGGVVRERKANAGDGSWNTEVEDDWIESAANVLSEGASHILEGAGNVVVSLLDHNGDGKVDLDDLDPFSRVPNDDADAKTKEIVYLIQVPQTAPGRLEALSTGPGGAAGAVRAEEDPWNVGQLTDRVKRMSHVIVSNVSEFMQPSTSSGAAIDSTSFTNGHTLSSEEEAAVAHDRLQAEVTQATAPASDTTVMAQVQAVEVMLPRVDA